MRVLLATDNYPPIIGGAQIQSRVVAQALRDRGHEVIVATVWQHGLPKIEHDDGIRVCRLRQIRTLPGLARTWRHHQPPFPDPVTVFGLRRLIARLQPDIVHSYGWISYSCAAAVLGTNIPLALTARDYAYSCAKRTLVYDGRACTGPALRKCLGCASGEYGRPKGWIAAMGVLGCAPLLRRKVRAIQSISTYVESIMRRDFVSDVDAVHITIHDVVAGLGEAASTSDETDVLSRLEELPDERFILFVGGLRRVKGLEQLFAAYQRLIDPPPLVLIGTLERDSPDFPPGIHVLYDFPHMAIMAAWERCLFAVLPSLLPEPFGTVVCEAMSRGKAVIGTVPGGHADMIVDDVSGLLVPAGDVALLADAMQRLISDRDLRERLGEAARIRAQMFTIERSIPQVEQLYERLVGRSDRPARSAT